MYCRCTGIHQIRLELWSEPDLAGFTKNGQIPDLLEMEPKSGTTLLEILQQSSLTVGNALYIHITQMDIWWTVLLTKKLLANQGWQKPRFLENFFSVIKI